MLQVDSYLFLNTELLALYRFPLFCCHRSHPCYSILCGPPGRFAEEWQRRALNLARDWLPRNNHSHRHCFLPCVRVVRLSYSVSRGKIIKPVVA